VLVGAVAATSDLHRLLQLRLGLGPHGSASYRCIRVGVELAQQWADLLGCRWQWQAFAPRGAGLQHFAAVARPSKQPRRCQPTPSLTRPGALLIIRAHLGDARQQGEHAHTLGRARYLQAVGVRLDQQR
jgi:hypothetical protein